MHANINISNFPEDPSVNKVFYIIYMYMYIYIIIVWLTFLSESTVHS